MRSVAKIIFVVVASLFLLACDGNKVFEAYIEVEDANWKKENIANFAFEVEDTLSAHNIYLNIRNTGDYPYSNLYLFVKTTGPDGKFNIDTVNCILANNRGQWKGKGIGDLWDLQVPYIGSFKFAHKGEYNISLEQAMRVESDLKGITDVGIRVEKSVNLE